MMASKTAFNLPLDLQGEIVIGMLLQLNLPRLPPREIADK